MTSHNAIIMVSHTEKLITIQYPLATTAAATIFGFCLTVATELQVRLVPECLLLSTGETDFLQARCSYCLPTNSRITLKGLKTLKTLPLH